MPRFEEYRSSGRISMDDLLPALGLSIGYAVGIGAAYALLTRIVPVIGGVFGAPVVLVILHRAVRAIQKKMRSRSRAVNAGVAAGMVLVTLYAVWVAYLWLATGTLALRPAALAAAMGRLADGGAYTIRARSGPAAPTSSWLLYAFWTLETLVLLIGGFIVVLNTRLPPPYCEACGEFAVPAGWTPCDLPTRTPAQLREELLAGDFSHLFLSHDDCGESEPFTSTYPHLSVQLRNCPKCERFPLITVTGLSWTRAAEPGKPAAREGFVVVTDLQVDEETLASIRGRFGGPYLEPPGA